MPEDNQPSGPPPEELKPQADQPSHADNSEATDDKKPSKRRRGTYRPSHKATFLGIAVVAAILAINVGAIVFLMKSKSDAAQANKDQVTIGPVALDKLGVSRNKVDNKGLKLTIGPDTQFNSNLTVAGNASIGGQLQLNGPFSASSASFSSLKAGDTALSKLNVNGDASVSNLAVRSNLSVQGTTHLSGALTTGGMLTVNNNANFAGNLSVGGSLSAGRFNTSNLVVSSDLTVGGHLITRGYAPSVSRGSAVGSNGTVSISGNDLSGTVAVNAGVGAGGGIVARINFHSQYGYTPHVVITPIGPGAHDVYVNRDSTGFSIGVGSLSTGGHAFDYVVTQ